MNEEHVATYIYDHSAYDVYAVYDTIADRDSRDVSFYDVYDKNGNCVNEGEPFYEFPTWREVFDSYYMERVN